MTTTPLLNPDDLRRLRSLMGEVLSRTGTNLPGPVAEAAEEFEASLQDIVAGSKRRRESRIEAPAPTTAPEEPRKRGAQPGNQNARKFGFTAQNFALDEGESPDDYARAVADALAHYSPRNHQEHALVMKIVNETWLLARLDGVASDLMLHNLDRGETLHHAFTYEGSDRHFLALSRYQSNLERSIDKTRRRLKELREEQRSEFWLAPDAPAQAEYKTNPPAPLPSNAEPEPAEAEYKANPLPPASPGTPAELPPLEEVILEFEAKAQEFSTGQLILMGYRFRDESWKDYESPFDTDRRAAAE